MTVTEYEAWVHAHTPALLRFAYLVTGSPHDAADVVQHALLALHNHWDAVSAQGDPLSYTRRSIVNAKIDGWRRFGKRQTPVGDALDVLPAARTHDPNDRVAERDALWRLCATLAPTQRAAVVLRFYEDLDYREIGAVLGCAEATARSHVHRALTALRTELTAGERQ